MRRSVQKLTTFAETLYFPFRLLRMAFKPQNLRFELVKFDSSTTIMQPLEGIGAIVSINMRLRIGEAIALGSATSPPPKRIELSHSVMRIAHASVETMRDGTGAPVDM